MGSPSNFKPEEYAKDEKDAVASVLTTALGLYGRKPLKVSDLLKLCTEVLTTKGDLTVSINVFHDEDNSHSIDPVIGHYFQVNDKKEAALLVLCDADHFRFANENMDMEESEVQPKGDN